MGLYTSEELLSEIKVEFLKDFSFLDVKKPMENVFTKDEIDIICKQDTEELRTEKMFFILIYKEKDIDKFINALANDYLWLSQLVKNVHLSEQENSNIELYISVVEKSCIPKYPDLSIHRYNYLWEIRQGLQQLKRNQYLIIQGKLCLGKRWLASDACRNLSIVKKMGYNVFWINVSKCKTPSLILDKLLKLYITLHGNPAGLNHNMDVKNEIYLKTDQLRKMLEQDKYKDCLLVLSDVQDFQTIKAFDLKCKIMLTTVNNKIFDLITSKKYRVNVKHGFTKEESLKLFAKALIDPNNPNKKVKLPPEASDVHQLCKGNPFIIAMIARNFQQIPRKLSEKWQSWVKLLKEHKLSDRTLVEVIEQSLRAFFKEHPKYKEYYKKLVVFTDNVNIPIKLLESYWDVNLIEADKIIQAFRNYSILEISGDFCSMHYLFYSHLLNSLEYRIQKEFHMKLVNSYKIKAAFLERKEPDLIGLPNDNYFYHYIGYHLKNSEMFDLFSLLYLDFGFLEQKLRATGLSNTIGDLEIYQSEIVGNNKQSLNRRVLLENLIHFLKEIEEMMFQSTDTCLLQYALMESDVLRHEAEKQIKRFSDRVWFNDIHHSHKRRQIVQLHDKPKIVCFRDPNTAIVALKNKSILLTDLSASYSIEPTLYDGHNNDIKSIKIFQNDYFASLDDGGILRIWSLEDTPIERRRISGDFLCGTRQIGYKNFDVPNLNREKSLQIIGSPSYYSNDKITCFYIFLYSLTGNRGDVRTIKLYCATETGRIFCYDWHPVERSFHKRQAETLLTKIANIHCLTIILKNYLMVLNMSGNIGFFNLINHSNVPFTAEWKPRKYPVGIHQSTSSQKLFCVFNREIVEIIYKNPQGSNLLVTQIDTIYNIAIDSKDDGLITCSAITNDTKYIILGTNKGIIVFDCNNKLDILRNSIGDKISCIDVCSSDHVTFNHILISGIVNGGNVANIYGLELNKRQSITLQSNDDLLMKNSEEQHQRNKPYTWLVGGDLFEVVNCNDNEFVLYAIDSKNRIHRRSSNDNFTIVDHAAQFNRKITAICSNKREVLIGCDDGLIFTLDVAEPILSLDKPIIYLKEFNENLLIGTIDYYLLLHQNNKHNGQVARSYLLDEDHLLIIQNNCSLQVLNLRNNLIILATIIDEININQEIYSSSDFNDGFLIVGTTYKSVYMISVTLENIDLQSIFNVDLSISCLRLSPDQSILAVGFNTGVINIYKLPNCQYPIQTLKSHRFKINEMVFSPWTDPNLPLILVSLSEQICFWNITYVINNSFSKNGISTIRRTSQRFGKEYKLPKTDNDESNVHTNGSSSSSLSSKVTKMTTRSFMNPWSNKIGASDKPELLSCIKFVSNSAKRLQINADFTKFITIDNEGDIYILSLIKTANENENNFNIL